MALTFDPIDEAARQWGRRWDAVPAMHAVTSLMRVQQLVLARLDAILQPHGLVVRSLLAAESGEELVQVMGDDHPSTPFMPAPPSTRRRDRPGSPRRTDPASGPVDRLAVVLGVAGSVVVLAYLLLARACRSLVLPLKAVILNLVSLAATFGIVVIVFQLGHGSGVWGIDAMQAINPWIPIMIFAFLFGLSMDYEVFMLTRMREAYDATGSTEKAIGTTKTLLALAPRIVALCARISSRSRSNSSSASTS